MEVNRNSSMANAKRDYQQAVEKLKNQYQKELSDIQDTHESRETNQRENYIKQKEETEVQTAERMDEYDQKVRNEIDTRQKEYLKKLKEQRDDNISERNRDRADTRYKLDSIKSSYDTAKEESDKLSAYNKKSMEERFDKGLTERENHFNTKLDDLQKRNIKEMDNYRLAEEMEKKYLVHNHENEKKGLIQETNLLRNEADSRYQLEKERLRQNHHETIDQVKGNAENQVANTIRNKDIQQENQRANYEEITQSINKRNADAFKAANLESKRDKRMLEREHSKNRMELQREINKIASEPMEKKVLEEKKKLEENWEQRLDHARAETARVKESSANQMIKSAEEQKLESAKRDLDVEEKLGAKDNEIRSLRGKEMNKLKDDFKNQLDNKTAQVNTIRDEAVKREVNLKKQHKHNMDLQRQEFNKEIIELTESREAQAAEMRDELAQEKTKFIESSRRQVYQDKANMREDMNEQFMRKEDALNTKIEFLEKENQSQAEKYEKKIDMITQKHAKEFEKYKLMQFDIDNANKRNMRRDMVRMQQNFDKEKMEIKNEFERKIGQAKSDSEIHIAKLTEKYEGMLNTERGEHQREMQRKTSMLYDELIRYKQQSDAEKMAMIAQYENKMNEMEQSHRAQLEIQQNRKTVS